MAVLLVPLTAVSLSNGFISTESMLAVTGAATFACLMLYAISYWVMRIVGVISVNRSRDFIRVGHLSFWGGRRNRFFLVDDVTPLSELSIAKSDLYTKLKSIESDEVMLLPLVGVAMPDRELFEVVFGKFDFTFNRNAIVDRFKKFQ